MTIPNLPPKYTASFVSDTKLAEIQSKALENKPLERVVLRALDTGFIDLNHTGLEKYNSPFSGEYPVSELPRSDGHFDIEGHGCADIEGIWYLNPLSFNDWMYWFGSIRACIELCIDEGWPSRKITPDWTGLSWMVRGVKNVLSWMTSMMPSYLNPKRYHWIWVINSFSVLKSDLADEKYDEIYTTKTISNKSDIQSFQDRLKEIQATIGESEVKTWLKENADQVSATMWVQKSDPTIIYIDDSVVLYDMKTGYSDKKFASIVKEWFYLVFQLEVQERLVTHG